MKLAAICIATYRRPQGLARLLDAIAQLKVPAGWHVVIRVVDNDPEGNQLALRRATCQLKIAVNIAHEPRRNIAHARNTAIAMGPADAFLFIDDDEIPSASWLTALLGRCDQGDADAIFGPVVGRLPVGTPRWLTRTGAFDKPGPDHDGPIGWQHSRTSSTLVVSKFIGQKGLWFDPEYGISGGSDTEFFRRAQKRGAILVHERRALVYEDIEPDRCNWRAVLQRRYRAGVVYGKMNRGSNQLSRFCGVIKRLSVGVSESLLGLLVIPVRGPELAFRGFCRCAVGIGAFRGYKHGYKVERYPVRELAA